jgi:prolyl 4-hydroxylase
MTDTTPAVIQADQLLAEGALQQSVDTLMHALQHGDAHAAYTLALWHVYGYPVPRDFTKARGLFDHAGKLGHREAARTHTVFVAIGAGGIKSWSRALALLQSLASFDDVAAREVDIISAMRLRDDGTPKETPIAAAIAVSPELFAFRSCFSADECAHVVALASSLVVPSVVVNPATGQQAPHPIRTSDGTVLGPIQQDMVVHALNLRIAALSTSREEQGEPLSLLRYRPGQQYRLHHDCLPGETNQRASTFIAYLNHAYTGGATQFPQADIEFQGSSHCRREMDMYSLDQADKF